MSHRATIITDIGFGDAGKGSIVDYLTRTEGVDLVVRFNGGSQAAHNVATPDGRHHTFSQFGSASLAGPARTHLSRFMLVHPLYLMQEAEALAKLGAGNVLDRTTIDEAALIITPYQQAVNRLRELARGGNRHGSCGHGIGETQADALTLGGDALRAGDMRQPHLAAKKLEIVRQHKLNQIESLMADLPDLPAVRTELQTLHDDSLSAVVADFYSHVAKQVAIVSGNALGDLLTASAHTVFEGAQGVLLDEWYGFFPYATRSTTTNANALTLLAEQDYAGDIRRLGLLRAYGTRHGAGPFVTEDSRLTAQLTEPHNRHNLWQAAFRAGYPDLVALRYALEVAGPFDALVVTCLDQIIGQANWQLATSYDYTGAPGTQPAALGSQPCVGRIAPAKQPSLDYQRQLTDGLDHCQPCYNLVRPGVFQASDIPAYLEQISSLLKLPIAIASAGPTATDKWTSV